MEGWHRLLITGVGGQGVMSAARWVGDACAGSGVPVVVGQVHGMSQRGGSVQATVATGGALSPDIPDGMADVLLALEPMEGCRALAKVSERSLVLVNTRPLLPASLQSQRRPYPAISTLLEPLREVAGSVIALDATALAEEAGSPRALNVVALGMLSGSGRLPVPGGRLLEIILGAGMPAFAEVNREAFLLGEKTMLESEARST
jgi:indolepyruvate ferredoxin oxidoreductase beta subunit